MFICMECRVHLLETGLVFICMESLYERRASSLRRIERAADLRGCRALPNRKRKPWPLFVGAGSTVTGAHGSRPAKNGTAQTLLASLLQNHYPPLL